MSRRALVASAATLTSTLVLILAILWAADRESYRTGLTSEGGPWDVLVAVALFYLVGMVGWRVIGGILPSARLPVVALATGFIAGQLVFGTALLVLGLLGWYRPLPLAGLLAIAAGASWSSRVSWMDALAGGCRRIGQLGSGFTGRFWLFAQGVGLLALLVVSLGPLADWDSLMYHVDVPLEFLEEGRLHLPVDNTHVAYVAYVQMLYLIPLAAAAPIAIPVFSLIGFSMLLGIMADTCRSLGGARAGRVGPVLVWATTSMLLVIDARVEIWVACLIVLAVAWSYELRRDGAGSRSALMCGGLIVGAGLALKFAAAPAFLLLLGGMAGFLLWRRQTLREVALLGLIVAGVGAPWFLKNYWLLGDAIYPFLSPGIAAPWIVELGAEAASEPAILSDARADFDLLGWLLAPRALTIEGSGAQQNLPLVLVVGLIPLLWRRVPVRRMILALIGAASVHVAVVVFVGEQRINLRYLAVSVVLLAICAAVSLGLASRERRAWASLVPLLLAVSLIQSAAWLFEAVDVAVTTRVSDEGRLRVVGPLAALDEYLVDVGAGPTILLFENRGAGMRSDVRQDSLYQTWPLIADLARDDCPELGGATHIVVNDWHTKYLSSRGVDLAGVGWDTFPDYADRCLEFIGHVAMDFSVYRLEAR